MQFRMCPSVVSQETANSSRATSSGRDRRKSLSSMASLHHTVNGSATLFSQRSDVYFGVADQNSRIERLKAALDRRHVADRDRARYLFTALGSSVGYWSGLLAGDRSFGEKIARRIEEGLRLPTNYLDDVEMSVDAMEIADLYDQLDEDGRRVLRATAHALMRPVGDAPVADAPASPQIRPSTRRAPAARKHDA